MNDLFALFDGGTGMVAGEFDDGGASEVVADMRFGSALLSGRDPEGNEISAKGLTLGIKTKNDEVYTFTFLDLQAAQLALALMNYCERMLDAEEGIEN